MIQWFRAMILRRSRAVRLQRPPGEDDPMALGDDASATPDHSSLMILGRWRSGDPQAVALRQLRAMANAPILRCLRQSPRRMKSDLCPCSPRCRSVRYDATFP